MTVEQTVPATHTCTCDRCGNKQDIEGGDAYSKGWSRLMQTTAGPNEGSPPGNYVFDLCATCTADFKDWMTAPTPQKAKK